MPPSVAKIQENTTLYTELRAHANELLNYVSYASAKEISDIQSVLSKELAGAKRDISNISELLLSSNSPIPLYDEMRRLIDSDKEQLPFLYSTPYFPFSQLDVPILNKKQISLLYHKANSKANYSSILSDISALFCSLIPTTELSLCVPYFDVKIVYPNDENTIPELDILKFVSTSPSSNTKTFVSTEQSTKFGFESVGMELFGLPQTLAPTTDSFKTTQAYQERGVDVLDPISPLLTLERASVQQIGVGGGLNTQSKVTLEMTLHDRSRLSDIETLTTANIFPLVTFRITYGWAHPDTNKMSGNVYAKILNSMRVTQDYSLLSVSLGAKSSSSIKVTLTLSGMGTHVSKASKVLTADGEYIPYSAIDNLVKQFIALKTKSFNAKNNKGSQEPHYSKIGSTVISSVTSAAASKKFVKLRAFYLLYEKLKTQIDTPDQLIDVVNILNSLEVEEKAAVIDAFTKVFDFGHDDNSNLDFYGNIDNSILLKTTTDVPFIPVSLANRISAISKESGFTSGVDYISTFSDPTTRAKLAEVDRVLAAMKSAPTLVRDPDTGVLSLATEVSFEEIKEKTPATVIPLAEMISHLVAKPLLASQPDIDEVRIHCFSFNSACGLMAEENIGNFPIVKSKFIQYYEDNDKAKRINVNSTAETAMSYLVKHVNNPSTPFFGFFEQYDSAKRTADSLKEQRNAGTLTAEDLQERLNEANEKTEKEIDELNSKYLKEKNIKLTDTSFVPPRVKHIIEVLPAYENDKDKTKPTRKIARIIVYDERSGGFNKLGNLVFSMLNSNSIARLNADAVADVDNELNAVSKASDLIRQIGDVNADPNDMFMYVFKDKKRIREIATNLYPTLIIGSEGSLIKEATYTSQPSGELQSSYLLTALQGQDGSSIGESAESPLVEDVFIIPSTVTLQMVGNTCIARGQTYYIDFNTGTTLDNSYTVTSVSHTLSPGNFSTTAVMAPTNSATIRSVQRQTQELVLKIKNAYNPTPKL